MTQLLKDVLLHSGLELKAKFEPLIPPSVIIEKLNSYVIGQHRAKEALALTVCYHSLLCKYNKTNPPFRIKKGNLMLVGPSGSGKTYLVETLGKVLKRKVLVIDISSYTSAGYVGRDIDSILLEALDLCNDDFEEVSKMIIFIDEVDKIADGNGDGVNGGKVQSQLLKLIEGKEHSSLGNESGKFRKGGDLMDTRDILWVFGGAFTKLTEDKKKEASKGSIGFSVGTTDTKESIALESEDLIKYGMARELVGRIGQTIVLDELTKDDFLHILTDPVDSLVKQYEVLGKLAKRDLKLSDDDLTSIVDKAFNLKLGARALKLAVDEHLRSRMYF
jgi:ATP-dependent Clp protease ATP-binding subunit ClpX